MKCVEFKRFKMILCHFRKEFENLVNCFAKVCTIMDRKIQKGAVFFNFIINPLKYLLKILGIIFAFECFYETCPTYS